jgi:hypothetical protein
MNSIRPNHVTGVRRTAIAVAGFATCGTYFCGILLLVGYRVFSSLSEPPMPALLYGTIAGLIGIAAGVSVAWCCRFIGSGEHPASSPSTESSSSLARRLAHLSEMKLPT